MIDSGFMPPFHPRSSNRNVHGGGCDVATREKIAVLFFTDENHCLHYILFLMQMCVAPKQSLRCLLNTREICWIAFSRWTISNRCMLESGIFILT